MLTSVSGTDRAATRTGACRHHLWSRSGRRPPPSVTSMLARLKAALRGLKVAPKTAAARLTMPWTIAGRRCSAVSPPWTRAQVGVSAAPHAVSSDRHRAERDRCPAAGPVITGMRDLQSAQGGKRDPRGATARC